MADTNDTTGSPLSVAQAGNLLDRLLLSDEEPQVIEPQAKGTKPKAKEVAEEEADPELAESELEDVDDVDPDLDGDESEEIADEEAEPAPKPVLHRVKDHDGKEIDVSIEDLKAGFMQRADYTRKTQAVAEDRKKVEALQTEAAGQRVAYAEKLKALDEVLQERTPKEPDWEQLRKEMKPEEFNALRLDWREHKDKLATVAEARRKADEAVWKDQAKAYETHVSEQETKLIEAIPEWSDKAKRSAEMTKIVNFAINVVGYDRKELATVTDHRVIKVVRDAMKYHEIVAKRKAAKAQVETADKDVIAPSGGSPEKKQVSRETRARMRLAKSGSVQDTAAVLLAIPGLIE